MILTGTARLGRDAELRNTQGGDAVSNFNVAFNYGRKDQAGNRPTQWVRCTLWGKQAEALQPYLLKGQQVTVVLRDVHLEEFDGNNGKVTSLCGTVSDIELVGGRPEGSNDNSQRQQQAPRQQSNQREGYRSSGSAAPNTHQPKPQQQADDYSDDIPF
jgi:single-strand DNA-binding protein